MPIDCARLARLRADGRVFAVTFDENALAATTEPVQVLDDVRTEATNGTLQFAVSESGALVYVPGGAHGEYGMS